MGPLTRIATSMNASPHTIRVNAAIRSTKCPSAWVEKVSIRCQVANEGSTAIAMPITLSTSRAVSGTAGATRKTAAATRLILVSVMAACACSPPARAARQYMMATVMSSRPYSPASHVESPMTDTRASMAMRTITII